MMFPSVTEKLLLLVIQQHKDGIHPIAAELAAATRRLAEQGKLRTAGVLITGKLSKKGRDELGRLGLGEIHLYKDPRYDPFDAETHSAALVHCVKRLKPEILLVGATPEGRILAPMAATQLGSGVTADCTELDIDQTEGLLVQTRPAFGGSIMARIVTPYARPQIATVRYGILKDKEKRVCTDTGETRILRADSGTLPASRIIVQVLHDNGTEEIEPERILALGAGIRAKEDIEPFREICAAGQLSLMCSRSLVERGWLPRNRQIGLSGQSVAPKLLLTLGISGSVQFMAGIQQAENIIAVNTDPAAPILRIADTPLIGDLYSIAQALLKTYQR